MNSYRCLICGYIHSGDAPPKTCPICDAPKEMFELDVEVVVNEEVNAYRCLNCEYIHKGKDLPDICPICGFSKEHFEAIKDIAIENQQVDFDNVLILGGGIGALSALETLRKMNDHISITMITNEEKLPYYRLNLTRFLCDEIPESELCIHGQYWYDENRIKIYKNRVIIDIDINKKQITMDDDLIINYDKLIVAIGAHPFVPPIKGINQPGIFSLRSIEDAKDIKKLLHKNTRVFVIGGGVLGLEAAGALNEMDANVTIGEGSTWLMPRQLNQQAASVVAEFVENSGIGIEYDFRTTEIIKDDCFKVVAKDGRIVEADIIVVATGVRPNTYLARKAGLEVNNGIVVNDYLRTSDKDVYAVGDISEHYGVAYGLWNIAQYQGKIAAMNMLGVKTAFGGVPRSNALKVLDIDVFSIGSIDSNDGSFEKYERILDSTYLMFIIHDGIVVGSIAIGYKSITHKIKKLVESNRNYNNKNISTIDQIIELLDEL